MPERILPASVAAVIKSRLDGSRVYELRLRSGGPVAIDYGGRYYYLSRTGLTGERSEAIFVGADEVKSVVVRAAEFSLYAVNDRLAGGFITIAGGIRIGVCGEVVTCGGEVKTIKDFTSVAVRVPHEVKGCADLALKYVTDAGVRSTLIVGPPGSGKTTILRDITAGLSAEKIRNVLLVDERSEIAAAVDSVPQLDVGPNTDVIAGCGKAYAFSYGIRSMRPDVIVTDELMTASDFAAVDAAVAGGVAVIASVHASSPEELLCRPGARELVARRAVTRYVFLSGRRGPGTYENIYDADMKCVRFGTA